MDISSIKISNLQKTLIVSLLAIAGVIAAAVYFVFMPMDAEAKQIRQQAVDVANTNVDTEALKNQLSELKGEEKRYKDQLEDIRNSTVYGHALSSHQFMRYFTVVCRDEDVEVVNLVDIGTSMKASGAWSSMYDFKLRGSYGDLMQIVQKIADLEINYNVTSMSLREDMNVSWLKRKNEGTSKLPWYNGEVPVENNNSSTDAVTHTETVPEIQKVPVPSSDEVRAIYEKTYGSIVSTGEGNSKVALIQGMDIASKREAVRSILQLSGKTANITNSNAQGGNSSKLENNTVGETLEERLNRLLGGKNSESDNTDAKGNESTDKAYDYDLSNMSSDELDEICKSIGYSVGDYVGASQNVPSKSFDKFYDEYIAEFKRNNPDKVVNKIVEVVDKEAVEETVMENYTGKYIFEVTIEFVMNSNPDISSEYSKRIMESIGEADVDTVNTVGMEDDGNQENEGVKEQEQDGESAVNKSVESNGSNKQDTSNTRNNSSDSETQE